MARRKSNKKNSKMILVALALLLALVGVVLFCVLNSVQFVIGDKPVEDAFYKGYQVVFGYTETAGSIVSVSVKVLTFSFMALLPIILVLGGIILALLGLNNKLFSFIGGVLLIGAAVLFIVVPNFVSLTEEGAKLLGGLTSLTGITTSFKASIGVYLGASFAGVAGLLTIGSNF